MFDAILFEKLGVPAVPIITRPFQPTADAIAELHGMAGYTAVAVDHPITSLTDDELRARAAAAAPAVADALLADPGPR
ncbi:MAG: hypothetical protein AAFN30_05300 [Actinomycetota bacterium]